MGKRFRHWVPRCERVPDSIEALQQIVFENRSFEPIGKLEFGDHGLEKAIAVLRDAIQTNKRIALYADYDVDGTMSCVSWVWFLTALGHKNFIPYIPCRFKEGYGVNLKAIQHLVENEKAEIILTMDTGITANTEASYCKEKGVTFICTDHHKIQPEKMPDSIVVNPKLHPDPLYQELCGCGVTFVLLRRLAEFFTVPNELWTDLLALTGMATICDVVPLNSVNHTLAKKGVEALLRSQRPVLRELRKASAIGSYLDEKDVGFRLGPRINAVGRLGHAETVIKAFLEESPAELVSHMEACNEERRRIQARIVDQARQIVDSIEPGPILFLGGAWHPGVVGIAASKIAETYWRPTWLFEKKDGICKGSARSIPGFDVTEAMQFAGALFLKFGGHRAAGGFTFEEANEDAIREKLTEFAMDKQQATPELWESRVEYDCALPLDLAQLRLAESIQQLRPYGHGFDTPQFVIEGTIEEIRHYNDKKTGEKRHTAVFLGHEGACEKIMFFNEVLQAQTGDKAKFLVQVDKDMYRGVPQMKMMGVDYLL
jgi:single-stranded-DNA-specific exonuclease